MNVFDCAIKREEDTRRYFMGLVEKATDPELKILFSMLADCEDEHKKRLLNLKRRMDGKMSVLEDLDVSVCSYRPFLTQSELLEEKGNDPDLYLFTVKKEEQDITFYRELAERAANEQTRKSLLMLADEERRHLERMEEIYAFVETPRTYLESGEFSNLRPL
ncbi:ferritin-like domain-containing protein [Geoanaerobacter pelophilus]|nr:ferritin family protein [Geoanaerobacter pelophilus]